MSNTNTDTKTEELPEIKNKIFDLTLEYFATVARYQAEAAIDSTGQLYLGTGLKMQNDWEALRSAVEDYRLLESELEQTS